MTTTTASSTSPAWINRLLLPGMLLAVTLFAGGNAQAAGDTWLNGSANGNWAASGNWTAGGNQPPQSGDSLVFGATTGTTTLTDNLMTESTYTLTGIVFNASAPAYTINAGTVGGNPSGFTLTGTIINTTGAGALTFNDNIAIGSGTNKLEAAGGTATYGGVISGTGNFTVQPVNNKSITLSGQETFTGNVTLQNTGSGTITISGALGANNVVNGADDYAGNLIITTTGSGNDQYTGTSNQILSGVISGANTAATFEYAPGNAASASVTMTLTNTETFAGRLEVSGGTLQIGNGVSGKVDDTSPTGDIDTVTGGNSSHPSIMAFDEANGSTAPEAITVTGATFNYVEGVETTGITNTLSGNITGTGSFAQNGAGETVLTGANTYGSTTTVSAGTLQIGNGTSGTIDSSSSVTVAAGTLAFDEANGSTFATAISNSGTVAGNEGSGITNTLSGVIKNAGGFSQTGAGTTILSTSATYTGTTAVNAGTLQLGNGNAGASLASTAPLSMGGGTLVLMAPSSGFATSSNLTVASLATVAGTTSTITLNPNGNANITSGSPLTLIITSNTVSAGASSALNFNLSLGTTNASTSTLGNTVVQWNPTLTAGIIAGGYTVTDAGGNGNATVVGGDVVRALVNTPLPTSGGVSTGNYIVNQSFDPTFTSPSTAGSLVEQLSASESVMSVTIDTTGDTSGANLDLNGTTLTVTSGGDFVFNGANPYLIQTTVGGGNLTTTAGGTIIFNNFNSSTVTISAPILDNSGVAVTFAGTGETILTATNTYTGATTVNSGTAQIGNGVSGTIDASTSVTVAGGTLAFDEANGNTFATAIANTGTVAGNEGSGITNTLSGVISGAGAFAQSGAGETILTNAETYTGATTVSAGTLQIGNGTSGSIASTSATVAGGTLAFDEVNGTTTSVTIADSGTVEGNEGASSITNTLSGVISGAGAFTQTGAGRTILTNANTYTGATTVSAGTLAIGNGTSGTIDGSTSVTVGASAQLAFDEANGKTFATAITDSGTVLGAEGTGVTDTLSGVISGAGVFKQNQAGETILTNTNTYTGATSVTAGILQIGNGTSGTIDSSASVTVTSVNGTLAFDEANGNTVAYAITDSGTVQGNEGVSSITNTLSGVISGAGAFAQNGAGQTILTATNTYTGATTVSAGTLQIGNGTSGTIDSSTSVTVAGGKLSFNEANGNTFATAITDNATVAGNEASGITNTLSGVISGSGIFRQNASAGETILTATNTYTGATTVSAGTLQIGNGVSGTIDSSAGPVVVAAASTLAFDEANGNTFATAISDLGTVEGNEGSGITNTLFGVISGSTGTFTQTGAGETILTGANTYTGALTISAGTVQAGNGIAGTQGATSLLVGPSGTFAFDKVTGNSTQAITDNGIVEGNEDSGITDTWSGAISGSGGFNQTGAGTTILAAAETFTGATTVSAGILQIGNGAGTESDNGTSGITVGPSGILAYDQGNNGNGAAAVANSNIVEGNEKASVTNSVSGVISGSGVFNQTGAGETILDATETYTGATTVSAGTLQIGNGTGFGGSIDSSASVTVAAGTLAFDELNGNTVAYGITDSGTVLGNEGSGITNTLSGVISGAGAFLQNGAGETILTATNTYTGATTVSASTLQIGNGTSGSIDNTSGVTVNNTAILAFDEANGSTTAAYAIADSGTANIVEGNEGSGITNTISGVISNKGAFDQTGAGETILTGADAYTGGTTVSAGTLQIGNGTSGTIASTAVTVAAAGTLAFDEANGNIATNVITDSGTVWGNEGSGITNTLSGVINNAGAFAQTGAGETILTATETYTGTTTVSAGTLQLGNGTSGKLGASAITVAAAGTLAFDEANGTVTNSAGTIADSGLVVGAEGSGVTNTLSGQISGSGSFTQTGLGETIFAAQESFTGSLSVSAGTLQLGNGGGSVGGIAVSSVTVGTNGTVAIDRSNGSVAFTNAFADSGLVEGNENSGATNTSKGVISGSGAVAQVGAGETILTGVNTYTGATTVSAGTLQIGNGTSGSIAGTSGVTVAAGTLAYDEANGATTTAYGIANSGLVEGNEGTGITNTLSNTISGSGAFAQTGLGETILTAANTFTGATTVSAGTLQIGNGGTGPGSIADTSGATVAAAATLAYDEANGTTTVAYGIANSGTVEGNEGSGITNTLSNAISGSGGFTQTGLGETILTNTNTYTGVTAVNTGILGFTTGSSLGAGTSITLGVPSTSSGTLQYTGVGGDTVAQAITAQGNGNDTIQNAGGGLLTLTGGINEVGAKLILNAGTGGLAITTVGITGSDPDYTNGVTFVGAASNYTGPTNIYNNGELMTQVAGALPTSTPTLLTLGAAAETSATTNTLDLDGTSQTVSGLASTGGGTNQVINSDGTSPYPGTNPNGTPGTLVIAPGTGVSNTFAGSIGGATGSAYNIAVTLNGADSTSVQVLSGTNTYTGATTINSGTLIISSTGSTLSTGTVEVANGGTLGGTGSTGNVTVDAGGNINLQDGAIDSLTVNSLSTGGSPASQISLDLQTVLGVTSVDSITDNGSLTLNSSTTINIGNLLGTSTLADGYYVLISSTGITGSLSNLSLADSGAVLDASGQTVTLVEEGTDIELYVAATGPSATNAYFNGAGSDVGTAANFDTSTSSNTTGAAITSGTNLFFSADRNSATSATVSAPVEINSVNFGAGGGTNSNIEISGAGSLQIDATNANGNTAGSGITITGGGADTISAGVVLGADQTWSADSGSVLTVSGQVSDNSNNYALTTAGAGTVILSNSTGNTYGGGTTVAEGSRLEVDNEGGASYASPTSQPRTITPTNSTGSGTGTGAVTVQSGGTLAGSGTIAPTSGGVTVMSGGTLASGAAQTNVIGQTDEPSNTGDTITSTGLTLNNSANLSSILAVNGGGTLTFDLGAGASTGAFAFSNPNTNSTYINIIGNTAGEVNFGTGSAINIQLVDLTAFSANDTLQLAYHNPYLLIQAGEDSDYANLVTTGGLDENGYVLGVGTLTDYTAFNISALNINGGALSNPYSGLQLYLYNGDLEVVPEPGTWALMLGGLAMLVFIQIRRRKAV